MRAAAGMCPEGLAVRGLERIERVSDGVPDAATVATRLATVRERIAAACAPAGRSAESIAILAVTKGFGLEAIEAAFAIGLRDIGENYYQEATGKFAGVRWPADSRRHFIGRLQRNKLRRIAERFDVVQTLQDLPQATALDRAASDAGKTLDVLIQINVALDQRAGVAPHDAPALAHELHGLGRLRLRGVMAVGPAERASRAPAFARAATCFSAINREFPDADLLSLGMSDDLEEAIAAGSNLVRLGTALFGPRPKEG